MKPEEFKIDSGTTIISNGKQTLMLRVDDCPPDPREWGSDVCHMYCWHSQYRFGDNHDFRDGTEFLAWLLENYAKPEDYKKILRDDDMDEDDIYDYPWTLKQVAELVKHDVEMEGITLYDHSGLSMGLGCYHSWDSGVVGIIWCDKERAMKELDLASNWRKISGWRDEVRKSMELEVRIYNAYLQNECYGWEYYEGLEMQESCWGYYADNGDTWGSKTLYDALYCLEGEPSEYKQFHGDYNEDIDDLLEENFEKEWIKGYIKDIDRKIVLLGEQKKKFVERLESEFNESGIRAVQTSVDDRPWLHITKSVESNK